MKTTLILFFVLLISFLAHLQPAHAQVYKWTDDKGAIHFTDDPGSIPEKFRAQAQKPRLEPQPPLPPSTSAAPPPGPSFQPSPAQPPVPSAPPAKVEGPYRDTAGRDEAYWRNRVEEWKRRMISAQEKEQALRTRFNQLAERANASKNQTEKYQLRQEREQVKVEMDQQRAQVEEAKKMLDHTLPEEAALFKARPEWLKH